MIRECFKTMSGIMFVSDPLHGIGLDPATLHPFVKSRPPALSGDGATIQRMKKKASSPEPVTERKPEEEHELLDSLSPVYDQLSLRPSWWIFEVVPFRQRWQRSNGEWETSIHANMARGRYVPRQKTGAVKVHRSVRIRMEARYEDGSKYVPHASFTQAQESGNLVWVD